MDKQLIPQINVPKAAIAEFCHRNQIRKLSLFGSVLRADFGPESDIDVLVEFEPTAHVGYFGLARMQRELTELLGRKVDLLTPGALSKYFKQQVLETALPQYEKNRKPMI